MISFSRKNAQPSRVVAISKPRKQPGTLLPCWWSGIATWLWPIHTLRSPTKLEIVESLLGLILLDPLVPAAGHLHGDGHNVTRGRDELKPVLSDETHHEQMNMSSWRKSDKQSLCWNIKLSVVPLVLRLEIMSYLCFLATWVTSRNTKIAKLK